MIWDLRLWDWPTASSWLVWFGCTMEGKRKAEGASLQQLPQKLRQQACLSGQGHSSALAEKTLVMPDEVIDFTQNAAKWRCRSRDRTSEDREGPGRVEKNHRFMTTVKLRAQRILLHSHWIQGIRLANYGFFLTFVDNPIVLSSWLSWFDLLLPIGEMIGYWV